LRGLLSYGLLLLTKDLPWLPVSLLRLSENLSLLLRLLENALLPASLSRRLPKDLLSHLLLRSHLRHLSLNLLLAHLRHLSRLLLRSHLRHLPLLRLRSHLRHLSLLLLRLSLLGRWSAAALLSRRRTSAVRITATAASALSLAKNVLI